MLFILSRWFSSGTHARSSSQQLESAVSRFWRLTQRTVRRSPKGIKPQGLKFIVGPAFLTVSTRSFCHVAHCQEDVNNNTPLEVVAKDSAPEFKWHILWEFVKPQLFALICAVVLAFGAAILNIQIPLMLGDLVNVVARFLRDNTGTYVGEMTAPALKLLGLYGIQGLLTSGYIILLSRVGERVAADMRKTLFASLLRQDVAFFDFIWFAKLSGCAFLLLLAPVLLLLLLLLFLLSSTPHEMALLLPHLNVFSSASFLSLSVCFTLCVCVCWRESHPHVSVCVCICLITNSHSPFRVPLNAMLLYHYTMAAISVTQPPTRTHLLQTVGALWKSCSFKKDGAEMQKTNGGPNMKKKKRR
uniref:ABC transmembrane type-1 domain-containing protein n=1 Tax=Oryzias melastigma TaxID=30732 RepID=A0A3B3CVL9_ORYME